MKKIPQIWPSILYKRPISKNTSLYNSIISKYNLNKPELNINSNEDGQILTETFRTEANKQKFKYLYSNFNNFKKLKSNNTSSNSGRYSVNNKTLKNNKKNYNEIPDNNSLFFQNKDNDNKIIPYYNNTCNISLNQHFYNIDYNNFTSTDSIIKKNDIESIIKKLKSPNKNKYFSGIINVPKKTHSNNRNKKKNIYLNSVNKIFPIIALKDANNSYDSIDNKSNSYFFNKIISKKDKKANLVNLFVNPNDQLWNINKTTDLNNYLNYTYTKTQKKKRDNINLTNKIDKNNCHQINNKDNNILKYTKKIISYNSFKTRNKNNQSSLKNSIPISNFKNKILSINKSQEKINGGNNSMDINEEKTYGNNSFITNRIDILNSRKILNSNRDNNMSNKNKNIKHFHSYFHLSKFNIINKKINPDNIQKNKTKRNDLTNISEKKRLSTSISTIKSILDHYKANSKRIKTINNICNSNSLKEKSNNSSLKINNISNNINKTEKILINMGKEISKQNINKSNMIKIDEYTSKRVNEFHNNKQKLKKINLNKLLPVKKNNSKLNIMSTKDKKELVNLKKIFTEHFSKEGNKPLTSNNLSSNRRINSSQNNKNKNYINFRPKQKIIEKENIMNSRLGDLLKKLRQTKINKAKKNDKTKSKFIKGNILNKKNNYISNQSNNQNIISKNLNKNEICPKLNINTHSISSEESTKNKENNEYMDQSQKLSEYIKDYYSKYNNYPQTKLNFYKIGRIIGQGGFAKVNLGLNVLTGRVVAIKSFNKSMKTKYGEAINMDKILYEINLMRKLNHQNITKILETFEDEQLYFIIMEYINGGNLFSYVKKRRKLSEKIAKFIFRQIILGIKHIHSQLIVHRDIKLENILIDMNNNIKICDFGIGIILSSENQDLHSQCGTPMYIAPEIILSTKEKGYKGFPVDIWSAGIALYIMVSGKLPFNLDDNQDDFNGINKENKEKNKKLKYEILNKEPKYIEDITAELRDLLKGLLNKDPNKRLNCEQILNHPWFDDIYSHKIHLFSKAEKDLLTKTFIDYRKSKFEDLIENFTFSNLFKDKKSSAEKYNCETKSSLLAPFNSLNYEFFNLEDVGGKKKKVNDEFDDFKNKKLVVEKDLFCFSHKAKELNFQYELDNNKEVDNGVLINTKSNGESNSSSFSNANSKRNFISDKNINLDLENDELSIIKNQKAERILSQIERFGYDREYVIKSLKNNYLNHATTIYFLLKNYENI